MDDEDDYYTRKQRKADEEFNFFLEYCAVFGFYGFIFLILLLIYRSII